MGGVKAIETRYNGYRFRSRLEARWAVFFDRIGVRYEYEPEGFHVGKCRCYLPDFRLPDLDWWVEIKPDRPNDEDLAKIYGLALSFRVAVFAGQIPERVGWQALDDPYFAPGRAVVLFPGASKGEADWDYDYRWCACRCGKTFGLQHEGRGGRISCGCQGARGDCGWTSDHPNIVAAYRAARAARFEYGETPQ